MKNIIFIGMPAVGKSTIGVIAAKTLGFDFIDADIVIQEQEGMLLREIIEERGIEGFLETENRINRQISPEWSVISPGGSIVYCEEAMRHYKEIGIVIYLHASFGVIEKRLKNAKNRGVTLREGQTLKDLYDERLPLFRKYADITICQDGKNPERTLDEILRILKKKGIVPQAHRLKKPDIKQKTS